MKDSSSVIFSSADQVKLENKPHLMVKSADIQAMLDRYQFSEDAQPEPDYESYQPVYCWIVGV